MLLSPLNFAKLTPSNSLIEKLSKDYPIVINAVNNSLINYYDDISDIQKISFESILYGSMGLHG